MNRVPVVIEPAAKSDIRAVRDYYSKAACSAQPDSWDPSHELHLAIIRSAEQIAVDMSDMSDFFLVHGLVIWAHRTDANNQRVRR